jgi:hypothetical protein
MYTGGTVVNLQNLNIGFDSLVALKIKTIPGLLITIKLYLVTNKTSFIFKIKEWM